MKRSLTLVFLILALKNLSFGAELLTDDEAIAAGMSLIDFNETRLKERSYEYKFKESDLDIAKVAVLINKSIRTDLNPEGQTLRVYVNGVFLHEFDTSTGTEKIKETTSGRMYIATTPTGIFRPKRAYREYESRTFRGASMKWAVFFNRGIATHSTSESAYSMLGRRASGGCARLQSEDAFTVNQIIRQTGEGHNNLVDAGVEGLNRKLYIDRIKLPNLSRFTGFEIPDSSFWTYDAVIIVRD